MTIKDVNIKVNWSVAEKKAEDLVVDELKRRTVNFLMKIAVVIIFVFADIGVIRNLIINEYIGLYDLAEYIVTIIFVTVIMIVAALFCMWCINKPNYTELGKLSRSDLSKISKYIEIRRLDSIGVCNVDDRDSLSSFPCIGSVLERWDLLDGLLNGDCCVELTHDLKYLNIYNIKKEQNDKIKIDKSCTNKSYDELNVDDVYIEFTLDEVKLYDKSLVNSTVVAREK